MSAPYRAHDDGRPGGSFAILYEREGGRVSHLVGRASALWVEGIVAELNERARRSGSPEGWPEGAELVTTAQILDEPGVWQVWNQPVIGDGSWTSIDEMTPGGLGVLGNCFPARRKPKPVTRDVLAWDLEPGMKLADGRTVQFTTRMLDSGKRLVEVACVGDRDHSVLIHDQTAAVLVEEPNG